MKISKERFSVEKDGFFGAYFQNPKETDPLDPVPDDPCYCSAVFHD